jgi:hypothetical protein
MEKKTEMDRFGALSLIGFAILLAFNQVVIKVTNEGFSRSFSPGCAAPGPSSSWRSGCGTGACP